MTGYEVRAARAKLGQRWLGRPLRAAELGRLLGLRGRDPGASVLDWEAGKQVTGPVALCIWYMVHVDMLPPTYDKALVRKNEG